MGLSQFIKKIVLWSWFIFLLPSSQAAPVAIEPPILRVSLETDPVSFDWNDLHSEIDRYLVSYLMRGLLKYDSSGKLSCDLCTSYTLSTEKTTYRFKIRTDVKWSDGMLLSAEHFVESFRRLLNPKNKFLDAYEFQVIEGSTQKTSKWDPKALKVTALDHQTLEINLSKPSLHFTHLLTLTSIFPIRREFSERAHQDRGVEMAEQAVLGPYFLAAWENGKRIVLEGNPEYKNSRPVFRVEFHLGNHDQNMQKFKEGKLDIFSNPTTEDVLSIPNPNVQVNPFWATRSLVFNLKKSTVSDVGFRKAILHSLDRASLSNFLKNGERSGTGLIPPHMMGYRKAPLVIPDVKVAQSQRNRVIAWPREIAVNLLIGDNAIERQLSEWLSGQLKSIKINLNISALSNQKYTRALENGDFDVALSTYPMKTASPLDILVLYSSGNPLNFGHWENDPYNTLLGKLYLEQNPKQAEALVNQMTKIIEEQDVAVVPLSYPTHSFLLSKRVNRFARTVFGQPDLINIQLNQPKNP